MVRASGHKLSLLIEGSQVRIPAETQFLLQGFTDGGATGAEIYYDVISISSGTSGVSLHSSWHPTAAKFREKMVRVNEWLDREVLPWWLDKQDGSDAD